MRFDEASLLGPGYAQQLHSRCKDLRQRMVLFLICVVSAKLYQITFSRFKLNARRQWRKFCGSSTRCSSTRRASRTEMSESARPGGSLAW